MTNQLLLAIKANISFACFERQPRFINMSIGFFASHICEENSLERRGREFSVLHGTPHRASVRNAAFTYLAMERLFDLFNLQVNN